MRQYMQSTGAPRAHHNASIYAFPWCSQNTSRCISICNHLGAPRAHHTALIYATTRVFPEHVTMRKYMQSPGAPRARQNVLMHAPQRRCSQSTSPCIDVCHHSGAPRACHNSSIYMRNHLGCSQSTVIYVTN